MNLSDWLVVIAGLCGVLALVCLWLGLRVVQMKERVQLMHRQLEDKAKMADLLSLAQKEIGALQAHKDTLGKTQEAMKLEFRHTANQLFEEVSQKFTTQSEKKIGDLLNPLQQRITDFQKKVDESFGEQGKEQHTLKAEITRIVDMNERMRQQAESLTKALRGDSKAQGNWGEVMLERILEESGLIKGSDYIVQAGEMDLKGAEGNRLRPDVIIHLPDGKHLIVDAKVSLTAYDRYCSAEDESSQKLHFNDFMASIKNHIVGLERKRYQDIDTLQTPDFVFMFLPVEGAYSLAVQQNRELHQFAWSRKIALVCPSTLFASLLTISSLWRIDRQNKNTLEIARQSGALYDKFVGLLEDLKKIGNQLATVHGSYESAMNKLSNGTGNLVGRVENLKMLGAKTTKSLPRELISKEEIA